ncbi:hypothetical protein Bca4012_053459 [Brassica carinata]
MATGRVLANMISKIKSAVTNFVHVPGVLQSVQRLIGQVAATEAGVNHSEIRNVTYNGMTGVCFDITNDELKETHYLLQNSAFRCHRKLPPKEGMELAARARSTSTKSVRLLSTSPCLTLCFVWDELLEGGSYIGKAVFYDPAKDKIHHVPGKTIPQELANSKMMGSSQGWGFFSQRSNHNSVCISDQFNPLSSSSKIKMIPLPPLTSMLFGQTKVVCNVAMSSSSPHEEDCVVAIKFFGRQLSMCKPGRDLYWTNRLIPFDCAENSNLMYSKRDQRFYLPAAGGNYLCSWDLNFDNDPKFNELVFPNFPDMPQSTWEALDSCIREDHWVESPSGQSFLVKLYSRVGSKAATVMVLVFREEEDQVTAKGTRNMCYTQDIGDLCIFLSKNDPFCVVASSCPGLIPNSIYMMDHSIAICELTKGTVTRIDLPDIFPLFPFWIPPCSV